MRSYCIYLDPTKQHIVPNVWPATIFGGDNRGIVVSAASLAEAIHEVSDEYGVSARCLTGREA